MDLYQLLPMLLPYIIVIAGGVILYLGLLAVTYVKLMFAEKIASEMEEEREVRTIVENATPSVPPASK